MTAQLVIDFTTESADRLADARTWRAANPLAYAAIVTWAETDAVLSGRCAMQRYIEALRDPHNALRLHVLRDGKPYLIDHRIRASLTRLVLSERPDLPFHIRRSSCDAPMHPAARP